MEQVRGGARKSGSSAVVLRQGGDLAQVETFYSPQKGGGKFRKERRRRKREKEGDRVELQITQFIVIYSSHELIVKSHLLSRALSRGRP